MDIYTVYVPYKMHNTKKSSLIRIEELVRSACPNLHFFKMEVFQFLGMFYKLTFYFREGINTLIKEYVSYRKRIGREK